MLQVCKVRLRQADSRSICTDKLPQKSMTSSQDSLQNLLNIRARWQCNGTWQQTASALGSLISLCDRACMTSVSSITRQASAEHFIQHYEGASKAKRAPPVQLQGWPRRARRCPRTCRPCWRCTSCAGTAPPLSSGPSTPLHQPGSALRTSAKQRRLSEYLYSTLYLCPLPTRSGARGHYLSSPRDPPNLAPVSPYSLHYSSIFPSILAVSFQTVIGGSLGPDTSGAGCATLTA